jgi:hypothetical protein
MKIIRMSKKVRKPKKWCERPMTTAETIAANMELRKLICVTPLRTRF